MSTAGQTPQAGFEHRLRFEGLLADLTARFVGLPSERVDDEIARALQELCEFLEVDRSTLWEFEHARPREAHLRHFSQIPGGPTIPERVNAQELFPWVSLKVEEGKEVILQRMSDLPAEATVDRESFLRFRSKSTVALPLRVGSESIGIVTFANINHERPWPEEVVTRLRLCAQVFANALNRRRIDLALRESEERFSLAVESAEAGLWSMNLETQSVWANPRLYELFQLSPDDELTFKSFLEVIHPEDRSLVQRSIEDAVQAERDLAVEFRAVMQDGQERWLSAHGRCQGGAGQECAQMVGLTYETTERRRAEEALRGLNQRLIRAHEEERARLARDLHDDLTQRLARLAIDLGKPDLVKEGTPEAMTVRSVREGLAQLSEDVHTLAYRLHPTILEDLGLVEALRTECDRFEHRESIRVDQDLAAVPEGASWEAVLALFRVAQECLRNVVRHSRARNVSVALREVDGGLELSVQDDGVGFDTDAHLESGHIGLAGMHERMSLVSGSLEIVSGPDEGTSVRARIPRQEGS